MNIWQIRQIINEAFDLKEGLGDDYLFHGTPVTRATKIVSENKIKKGLAGMDIDGVSLSREWRFPRKFSAQQETGVVFVLDKQKLKQRYKITQTVDFDHGGTVEQEEVVHSDIFPLNNYLVSIICDVKAIKSIIEKLNQNPEDSTLSPWITDDIFYFGVDAVINRFNEFLKNPKINAWIPRGWK